MKSSIASLISTARRFALSVGFTLAVVGTVTGCGDDSSSNPTPTPITETPSPSVTPTQSSPSRTPSATSVGTATGGATGNVDVDRVIAAIASGNASRVSGAIQFTKVNCVTRQGGIGSPPVCPAGTAENTPVDAFSMELGCDGTWVQPSAIDSAVSAILMRAQKTTTVFAVVYAENEAGRPDETNTPPARYSIIFGKRGEADSAWFVDVDTGIVREMMGCGNPPEGLVDFRIDKTQANGGYLVRP